MKYAEHPWQVRVCPGFEVAAQGDDIPFPDAVLLDLATGMCSHEPCQPWPCPPSRNTGGEERVIARIRLPEANQKIAAANIDDVGRRVLLASPP